MRIKVFTLAFYSEGQFHCQKCGNRLSFPDNTFAVLRDTGRSNLLYSVTEQQSVLHMCGRKVEWHCDTCKRISEPVYERKVRKRGKQLVFGKSFVPNKKCVCGGTLIQREYK